MTDEWDSMTEPHSTTVEPNCVTIEIEDAAQAMWTPDAVYAELVMEARKLDVLGPNLTIRIRADLTLRYLSSNTNIHYVPQDCGTTDPASCHLEFIVTLLTRQFDPSRTLTYRGVLAHEYGHVWAIYYRVLYHRYSWIDYETFRPLEIGGPNTNEIIPEDYRQCFATPDARHSYSFYGYPPTWEVPGLCSWLADVWEVTP